MSVVGKGRKERTIPLWRSTTEVVRSYIDEHLICGDQWLFPGRNVEHLTRFGARSRLNAICSKAVKEYSELGKKRISLHVLRHSTAVAMLGAGIDLSTIAIWLGHEKIQTTHGYMVADMALKERALLKADSFNPFSDVGQARKRFKADSDMLAFLKSL